MRRYLVRCGVASCTLLALIAVSVSALARAESTPPWIICGGGAAAAQASLEYHLRPSNEASVTAGVPVEFSSESTTPVTYSIASSPALLGSPDIDTGLGAPGEQAEPYAFGLLDYTYTFTSAKASATPRTIYWQASFSITDLPDCENETQPRLTTVRTLTVLAPPVSVASEQSPAPTPTVTPSVSVKREHAHIFTLSHPTIAYHVRCSASCAGSTSYDVVVLRRANLHRLTNLGSGSASVSIPAAAGGDERFSHRYSGKVLWALKTAVGEGRLLELQITVNVAGASGVQVQAKSTTRM